ncbi:MAG TPA: hypothetical protein VF881_00915 [Polyangiaceae bacterium]
MLRNHEQTWARPSRDEPREVFWHGRLIVRYEKPSLASGKCKHVSVGQTGDPGG